MKPYHSIPIHECGEHLVTIPQDKFTFFDPHPYVELGAPYGKASPWMLRSGVLAALEKAQSSLETVHPSWKIKLFDAYRPNKVQQFMVDREFAIEAKIAGFNLFDLTPDQKEQLALKVFRLWGVPSDDPTTPPPHSTGGAIDLTLADQFGNDIDMGSPIDENSDRSNPDHFINAAEPDLKAAHENRTLLNQLMVAQGFIRHPAEWWHFSMGDQYWAMLENAKRPDSPLPARYGRADLVKSPA